MISEANSSVGLLDRAEPAAPPVSPHVPSYQVRWTPAQRLSRWFSKPVEWLRGRLYRRFLQIFAPGVAFWVSELPIVFSIVATLTRLRIFDRVESGPQSCDDLARATGTDAETLLRFLRAAAAMGFLKRHKDGRYSLSPVGRQFLQNSPNPVAPWTELLDRVAVPLLPRMTEALVQGESVTKIVHQRTCWEVLQDLPGTTELHDRACGGWTELIVDEVARTYDFSEVRSVVDVGGGRGAFLCAMLKAAPHLTGRVYDRDTTKLAARERFERNGVAERAAHESGNFFESVPAGADLYTIKHALHDWDDQSAETILRNIRRAIPKHGKLLIVEGSVDHDLQPGPALRAVWDVTQFAATWGKSRTLDEFSALAHRTGFRLANVYVPKAFDALILECLPVEQTGAANA